MLGVFGHIGQQPAKVEGRVGRRAEHHDTGQGNVHQAQGVGREATTIEVRRLVCDQLQHRGVGVLLDIALGQGQVRGDAEGVFLVGNHLKAQGACAGAVVEPQCFFELHLVAGADVQCAADALEVLGGQHGPGVAVAQGEDVALPARVFGRQKGMVDEALGASKIVQRRVQQGHGSAGHALGAVMHPPGEVGLGIQADEGRLYVDFAVVDQRVFEQGLGKGMEVVEVTKRLVQAVLAVPLGGDSRFDLRVV